jgi:Raf kinase inhibitor-like YbhB/YbcL family protein
MLEKLPAAVGHFLHGQRAGLEKIVYNLVDLRNGQASIDVSSLAFIDHGPMPERYTADGAGVSPPLSWSGVPAKATSLAIVVEDADAPTPSPLVHAIVVDIAPQETALAEGALASPDHEGAGLVTGRNSFLQSAWLPPDPPPGHGVHRYAFQVYALVDSIDEKPQFTGTPGRDDVIEAIKDRAIASGCLIGTYERPDPTVNIEDAQPEGVMSPQPPLAI